MALLAFGIVNTGPVPPSISTLLNLHWYSIGSVPWASTVNVAVSPSITRASTGCCVIVIGTYTMTSAGALSTVPASLLMLTVYSAASVVASSSKTNSLASAPVIAWPSFCHWYTKGSEPLATIDNVSAWPNNLVAPLGCARIVTG